MRHALRLAGVVALAALALGACAGEDTSSTTPTGDTSARPTTSPSTTPTSEPASTSGTVAPYVSPVYADPASWLCRPETVDPCDDDGLALSEVAAGGTVTPMGYERATDAPIDCFYVYPTTSEDPGLNSDLVPGVEAVMARYQAGRFSQVCNVYAPMYPSLTLAGLFSGLGGAGFADVTRGWGIAYEGVRDAWRHYLANDNDGRPVVLIGHSQGTGHLIRLLDEEIDGDPVARDRVLSAILLGGAVAVPEGEVVGGVFEHLPLCTAAGETGCVLTYATFDAASPPGDDAFFGAPNPLFSPGVEGTAGCTDPAQLLGEGSLRSAFGSGSWAFADPTMATPITTPYMDLPGLVHSRCATDGTHTWLEVAAVPGLGDVRTATLPSYAGLGSQWGLHALDMELAQESLIELVRRQVATWQQGG